MICLFVFFFNINIKSIDVTLLLAVKKTLRYVPINMRKKSIVNVDSKLYLSQLRLSKRESPYDTVRSFSRLCLCGKYRNPPTI